MSILSLPGSVKLDCPGFDDVVTREDDVYLKMGTYQQSVNCIVMPLLHEVDVILGQSLCLLISASWILSAQ